MTKETWLSVAEVVDALRVIPRLMLMLYGGFYLWYIIHTTHWYFSFLNSCDSTEVGAVAAATAFVTSTITALGGMFTWFAGSVYMKTGRVWGNIQREEITKLMENMRE